MAEKGMDKGSTLKHSPFVDAIAHKSGSGGGTQSGKILKDHAFPSGVAKPL